MANSAFQPEYRSDVSKLPNGEFRNEWADEFKKTGLTVSYPANDNEMPNMMAFYFNSLVTIESEVSGGSLRSYRYIDFAGSEVGDVPLKNKAYQAMLQDNLIGAIKGDKPPEADPSTPLGKFAEFIKKAGTATAEWLKDFKTYKRTDNMIWMLPPTSIRYNVGANWQELNFDANALGILAKVINDEGGLNWDAVSTAGEILKKETVSGLINMLGEGNLGDTLQRSVQNTFNDMTFGSMQRRQFQFSWSITPKSREDVKNIDKIIRLFKFHAHPSFREFGQTLGAYLTFPGQVDVEWYTLTDEKQYIENAWLPKISSCVITGIETDYSPNNHFVHFNNSGAPAAINFTINLTEVIPLVKDDIARGF